MSTRFIVFGCFRNLLEGGSVMRKFCAMIAIGALLASNAQGAIIAEDSFSYAVGGLDSSGDAADPGWSEDWRGGGSIVAGSLVDGTGTLTTSGNQGNVDTGRNFRGLDTAYGETGTVYLSFLQQYSATGAFYAFELHDGGDADGVRTLAIGAGASGNPYGAFSDVNGGSFTAFGSDPVGSANLIVLKFTFGAGATDVVDIFLNPDPAAAEPAATVTLAAGNYAFDRLGFAQFVSRTQSIDEIRLGDTFADVTPVPEPTSLVLLGLGGVMMLRRRRR